MTRIYPTKNDLPENVRREMARLLNQNLASAAHLILQAKQAHWNVKGPHFFQLHQLFDKVHESAEMWSDLIAERAVQLGGIAESGLETISERSELPAYPADIADGRDHVDALSRSLAIFAKSVRAGIDAGDRIGDIDTSDVFTEVSRAVDKMLWFVEAHLQAER